MGTNESTRQDDKKFGTDKPISRFAEVLIATRKLALLDAKTSGRLSSLRMWVIVAIRQILVNQATFVKLIDERMASASVSMLRMQLDIGARTNALFPVEDRLGRGVASQDSHRAHFHLQ
jgi:hypothetical protein